MRCLIGIPPRSRTLTLILGGPNVRTSQGHMSMPNQCPPPSATLHAMHEYVQTHKSTVSLGGAELKCQADGRQHILPR